ncbi:cbb3-type cytochrome c oxidase subunit III [Litoreibacter ponti]|uniref:Cbb3-type cytochrome c oxidase subunit III n=1 Tax=Litoreibacter ponti TaxID=1510457 RepID=A0A2T6BCK9_9RHOB|nr:cytochrome c [Litoreibacter ponti]PTX53808.1 cbb3-type cytochrome c oxidase subunit III [Litoreibacter ponti]
MQFRNLVIAGIGAAVLTSCTQASTRRDVSISRGKTVYAKECAQCHGARGEGGGPASLGLGLPPPDLVGLRARNDGYFPREFVRRFVLGLLETDDPMAAMPEFGTTGFRHVYPDGGFEGKGVEADLEALLDYLETVQE